MGSITKINKTRTTKETNISVSLGFCGGLGNESQSNIKQELEITTQSPFFTHMLHAMLFHGGWTGSIEAKGDVEVDDHHLVEDVGIVLGQVFLEYAFAHQPYTRFGHAVIPMDDSLAECSVDFSNRAFLHYHAQFPQPRIGAFDVSLGREFFTSFSHNAHINLHLEARYGLNSHHIIEAMFKACGRATRQALQPIHLGKGTIQSTKGVL